MNLYKFLDNCIKIRKLNDLIKFILKNYKYFDKIKKLNRNITFRKNLIEISIYDESENESNLMLMYRILEFKFYQHIEKTAKRRLMYKDEINNNKSENIYLVFASNTEEHFDILKVYLLFYYANLYLFLVKS